MKRFSGGLWPYLALLTTVCVFILFANFPFGSWYTGWDNLHPEFNFGLNFRRALASVWQENQGLGTYGGHGYAATLPHTILVAILSLVIPIQYLRSSFTFLMLFTGVYGLFFLARLVLGRYSENIRNQASLLASLFYMLNLAVAQQFYIQLEAFIVHFACLPWLFYLVLRYLKSGSGRILLTFGIVSLFATVQGFIPPLFFVYLVILSIFLLSYLVFKPNFQKLKRVIAVFVLTLAINAYWFFPVAYYTATRTGTYLNAYNNLSSTEDFVLKNKKYGNLEDAALLKGFIFEAIDSTNKGEVFPIFTPWLRHIDVAAIKYIGYILFFVILIGLVRSVVSKGRNYVGIAFFVSFFLVFSLLATGTPPFSYISSFFQEIPVAKQAFRVAFTKFSVALAFLYALGFGLGVAAILRLVLRYFTKYGVMGASAFIALLIIVFSWPIFRGNLLYDRTRLAIPQSYFELFEFFDKQNKKTRIANFPQGWNWGWSIYRWGYSGSGFLWYGIEQPILDRAFDVWGKYNENYFWELHYAIYSENFPLIDQLVEKYGISWIVLDKNILPYANPRGYIYTEKVEVYLNSSEKYEKVRTFSSPGVGVRDVLVYEVNLQSGGDGFGKFVSFSDLKNISPSYNFIYSDRAYGEFGDYYYGDLPWDVYYPYRNMFTARRPGELGITIEEKQDRFEFLAGVPESLDIKSLEFPWLDSKFFDVGFSLDERQDTLSLFINKVYELGTYLSSEDPAFLNHEASPCSPEGIKANISQDIVDGAIRFKSLGGENCYTIVLGDLEHRYGYLVAIESRNIEGKSLQFAVVNHDSRKADIAVDLSKDDSFVKDYIVIPPMKLDGVGYSLNFNNVSIGKGETVNELKSVKLYPIPFTFLANIKVTNSQNTVKTNDELLVFYQSFDPGWRAYELPASQGDALRSWLVPFLGKKVQNHVLVNNWANGWILPENADSSHVVMVFLPQYLEYAGLAVLVVVVLVVSGLGLLAKYLIPRV